MSSNRPTLKKLKVRVDRLGGLPHEAVLFCFKQEPYSFLCMLAIEKNSAVIKELFLSLGQENVHESSTLN